MLKYENRRRDAVIHRGRIVEEDEAGADKSGKLKQEFVYVS